MMSLTSAPRHEGRWDSASAVVAPGGWCCCCCCWCHVSGSVTQCGDGEEL